MARRDSDHRTIGATQRKVMHRSGARRPRRASFEQIFHESGAKNRCHESSKFWKRLFDPKNPFTKNKVTFFLWKWALATDEPVAWEAVNLTLAYGIARERPPGMKLRGLRSANETLNDAEAGMVVAGTSPQASRMRRQRLDKKRADYWKMAELTGDTGCMLQVAKLAIPALDELREARDKRARISHRHFEQLAAAGGGANPHQDRILELRRADQDYIAADRRVRELEAHPHELNALVSEIRWVRDDKYARRAIASGQLIKLDRRVRVPFADVESLGWSPDCPSPALYWKTL